MYSRPCRLTLGVVMPLESTSAFVFSKIIEAMVTNANAKNGFYIILCINVNITIDTMLKFDANSDANVNIDAQCERTFKTEIMQET